MSHRLRVLVGLPCTAYRQLFLVVPHRLRVSVGLPMHRLSPIIVRCALSSSLFSWFVHAHLIANNCWLCLVVFAFQLVCPCTAYRQLFLAVPSRLRVSVGLPMYLLSLVIHAQTNTNTPRCLMRSVANDNIAAYIRHRGALNPNRSLDRLPIILGCFHRFLFIFRLLVGILPVLFS